MFRCLSMIHSRRTGSYGVFNVRNQPVLNSTLQGEIMLDIPVTFTYHTQAFATGLATVSENSSHQLVGPRS